MTHPRIYSANVRPESLLAVEKDAGWRGGEGGGEKYGNARIYGLG